MDTGQATTLHAPYGNFFTYSRVQQIPACRVHTYMCTYIGLALNNGANGLGAFSRRLWFFFFLALGSEHRREDHGSAGEPSRMKEGWAAGERTKVCITYTVLGRTEIKARERRKMII